MSEDVPQEEVEAVVRRTLEIEEENLHYERPPTIIKDIKGIVEEEVTEVDIEVK
jgi:hypothetical protein